MRFHSNKLAVTRKWSVVKNVTVAHLRIVPSLIHAATPKLVCYIHGLHARKANAASIVLCNHQIMSAARILLNATYQNTVMVKLVSVQLITVSEMESLVPITVAIVTVVTVLQQVNNVNPSGEKRPQEEITDALINLIQQATLMVIVDETMSLDVLPSANQRMCSVAYCIVPGERGGLFMRRRWLFLRQLSFPIIWNLNARSCMVPQPWICPTEVLSRMVPNVGMSESACISSVHHLWS